jgi:hypothetical protein
VPKVRSIDVAQLIKETVKLLVPQADLKGLKFETILPSRALKIFTDRERV